MLVWDFFMFCQSVLYGRFSLLRFSRRDSELSVGGLCVRFYLAWAEIGLNYLSDSQVSHQSFAHVYIGVFITCASSFPFSYAFTLEPNR